MITIIPAIIARIKAKSGRPTAEVNLRSLGVDFVAGVVGCVVCTAMCISSWHSFFISHNHNIDVDEKQA
jgi:hypothetical protein